MNSPLAAKKSAPFLFRRALLSRKRLRRPLNCYVAEAIMGQSITSWSIPFSLKSSAVWKPTNATLIFRNRSQKFWFGLKILLRKPNSPKTKRHKVRFVRVFISKVEDCCLYRVIDRGKPNFFRNMNGWDLCKTEKKATSFHKKYPAVHIFKREHLKSRLVERLKLCLNVLFLCAGVNIGPMGQPYKKSFCKIDRGFKTENNQK